MIVEILIALDTLWSDPGSGPWSNAPVRWYGDTALVRRTGTGAVLNASSAGKVFLWADAPLTAPACWAGQVRLKTNPSSSNYIEVRVAEDGSGNGVGIRFGAIDDGISLGKLSKNSLTTWEKSVNGILNQDSSRVDWKLKWNRDNFWILQFKFPNDSAWTLLDSTQYVPSHPIRYTGWKAVFTLSNRANMGIGRWAVIGRPAGLYAPSGNADRPPPMGLDHWQVTEILASPSSNRIGAPRVDFLELVYLGSDTLETAGWSISVNQYTYPLSPKKWAPGEVACIGDSMGFPIALRKKVWHGKIQILSSYCWIQLRDQYRRPVVQSHLDPTWFVPKDKSSGGFSWEAKWPNLACLNPVGWETCDAPLGSTPGTLPAETQPPMEPRTGGIRNWRWVDANTLELDFRHPMACLSGETTPIVLNEEAADSLWAVSPSTWNVYWKNNALEPHKVYALDLKIFEHADRTLLDTVLAVGAAQAAVPGDWMVTEILLNPLPGEPRFIELHNRTSHWLDAGELRWSRIDPTTGSETAFQSLAPSGLCVGPGKSIALAETWGKWLSNYPQHDSLVCKNSPGAFMWYDEHAIGRLEDSRGQLLLPLRVRKENHFPGLPDEEGQSLVPLFDFTQIQDSLQWTSHAPNRGSPGIPSEFSPVLTSNATWTLVQRICSEGAPAVVVYQGLAAPAVASVWVSALDGSPLVTLAKEKMLGAHGTILWDGKGPWDNLVPPGVYLLWIQGVNAKNRMFTKSWAIRVT